jgi:predicted PurR-regulated permease PerM
MQIRNSDVPLYLKISQLLIGITAFFYIMYVGQDIIVPIVFATILAILLNPIVNFLCNKGWNRVIAILAALCVTIIILFAISYFIGSQLSIFTESFPQFREKINLLYNDITGWVNRNFNVSRYKFRLWVEEQKNEGLGNGSKMLQQTLGTISNFLIYVFLLPVYIFMILFYKPLLLDFISQLFATSKHKVVAEVLIESKTLIQSYLLGLLLEAFIIAVISSAGLFFLGIEYAILLGIIGALLNIIPYIGGLIGTALPMIIALATKGPKEALYVFILFIMIQFLDNNFIMPRIVASKVRINAFVSIVVVLVGGALWGVAGMFLSIPLTAILKVICDRVDQLKPLGFLIGDNQPEIGKMIFNFSSYQRKKKRLEEEAKKQLEEAKAK